MLRDGKPPREVRELLGISCDVLKKWRKALGLPPSLERAPHPLREEARRLLCQGRRPSEVARHFGLSLRTVSRWRRELDLPPLAPPPPVEPFGGQPFVFVHPKRPEAEELLRRGKSPEVVATILGVNSSTVREWRRRLEVPPDAPPADGGKRPRLKPRHPLRWIVKQAG